MEILASTLSLELPGGKHRRIWIDIPKAEVPPVDNLHPLDLRSTFRIQRCSSQEFWAHFLQYRIKIQILQDNEPPKVIHIIHEEFTSKKP